MLVSCRLPCYAFFIYQKYKSVALGHHGFGEDFYDRRAHVETLTLFLLIKDEAWWWKDGMGWWSLNISDVYDDDYDDDDDEAEAWI